MKIWIRKNKWLLIWFAFTFLSSILHYVHNVIYFSFYPEPIWLNPDLVDYCWFVMTPFGLLGLWFLWLENKKTSFFFLSIYCIMNLLTLGHYGCEVKIPISFAIHSFIWLEAIAASVLWGSSFKMVNHGNE